MKEVPALAQIPEIYPAHASRPFVRPHGSGIVFSAVFPRGMECGLQLIHTPDGETLYIPFTDEFRVGRVCSAMITPLDSKEWMYRYKSGEHWIPDPHAFAIGRTVICEGEERKEVTACSCAPLRAGDLFAGAPEKPLPPADWSKEVIYGLHIRGFSAARESLDENLRGTFTGAAAGIPYRLCYIGTPAEETLGGKVRMIEGHAFDGVAASIEGHPFHKTTLRMCRSRQLRKSSVRPAALTGTNPPNASMTSFVDSAPTPLRGQRWKESL